MSASGAVPSSFIFSSPVISASVLSVSALVKACANEKDNGPIEITADQLWKYSGKVEKNTPFIEYYKYNRGQDKLERISEYFENFKTNKNGDNNKKND